jgi:hypothetical protein
MWLTIHVVTGESDTLSSAEADALMRDGRSAQTIGAVTLGVGVAALATAGGVWLFSSSSEEEAPTVSVSPVRDGAFVSVGGRFP